MYQHTQPRQAILGAHSIKNSCVEFARWPVKQANHER